jgi:glycosyltransferase involved in cell wall biosynthesis
MTMSLRIVLIGSVNEGVPPRNGEEAKNQILCSYLAGRSQLTVVDTTHWRRNPIIVPRVLFHCLFPDYDRILISASSASTHTLLRALAPFKRRLSKTIYMVIGGYLHIGIERGRYKAGTYDALSSLIVEGETMKSELKRLGVTSQVQVIPNFKILDRTWGDSDRYSSAPARFVFLSRVSESKGIGTIFNALEDERLRHRKGDFTIDFYGPVEEGYADTFHALVDSEPNTGYKGYLDIYNDRDGCYRTISSYHAMLFPTTWMGEGFPGVVLDAMVCGLPVIASDWNMNREVVVDGETGRIIPPNDAKALADMILDVLENRDEWRRMSQNSLDAALQFDAERLLDRHLPYVLPMGQPGGKGSDVGVPSVREARDGMDTEGIAGTDMQSR